MVSARTLGLGAVLSLLALPAVADNPRPTLEGRAVLPVYTLAPGPASGAALAGTTNGITFPLPSQPVEGFSAVLEGREPGEYLAMPDNGYGGKGNSKDFLIRAYYIKPDFKTATGGSGTIEVRDFIQFSDPDHLIGFQIVREDTAERWLTGGDIDPESLQRDHNGDFWMGEEFGPWILHFAASGNLLHSPYEIPGVRSPNNPFLDGQPNTHPNSRGFEALAITPNGKHLYGALEGPVLTDPNKLRRHIYEFSIDAMALTGKVWEYKTENIAYMVADMWALDDNRMVLIERDGGLGLNARFRNVYLVDLRRVGSDGFLEKDLAVDLTAIPDPDLISLPPIHEGDVGLGDPFSVVCESIEAIHVIDGERLLLGCDNNLPNKGRNPGGADDNEFILVRVPGLKSIK
jgi:glycerophosphoryl diester phosphodiesterase